MLSLLNPKANLQAFKELLSLLTRHRRLTFELAKREICERYSGQMLGAVWAIGHPLLLTLVYIFVFSLIFNVRIRPSIEMPLDYTTYLLVGITPWLAFQEVLSKSSTIITSNSNLVKQVIFPIDVLPVKTVLATLFTEAIFFGLVAAYTLIANRALPATYFFLPVLFVLQALAMIGVSYLLSAIGVFFRDIRDLVQVFLSVAIFILPILYLPTSAPRAIRIVLYANPLSHMIWCYQDILYFGRVMHWWAWIVFGVTGLFIFVAGYRVFRKLKTVFGNTL